jgi:hypothetical protein
MVIEGTREEIKVLKNIHPCWSQTKIAKTVGKTRQWVSHVLNQEGLNTKRKKVCINCGEDRGGNKMFCSRKCFTAYHNVEVTCEVCGVTKQRKISEVLHYDDHHKRAHTFCSKQCQGKWLGDNFGKGRSDAKEDKIAAAEVI